MNKKKIALVVALLVIVPFIVPEGGRIPVLGASTRDWNVTKQTQGWKRMFFVDPGEVIT